MKSRFISNDEGCDQAAADAEYAALQEALAEQAEPCRHRIADARNPVVKSGYVCIDCGALFSAADHFAEQAEQEPVAYLCPSFVDNYATGRYETCEQKDYGAFPVYAAPVRTKDLTDDEIAEIHGCPPAEWVIHFARAVIAADREKNK